MSKFQNSVKAFPGRSIMYCPSTWLVKHRRMCLIAFGDRRHHVECDLHVRTPAARRSVWPPTPAEIAICIPWKREIYLSDSVSARLCSACPRRHPIQRFRSVPGGCTCTQSRATWPQDTPQFQAGWTWGGNNSATYCREGPLQVVATAPKSCPMSKQLRNCCAWCKAVRPILPARFNMRLHKSRTDQITIFKCFPSFAVVV